MGQFLDSRTNHSSKSKDGPSWKSLRYHLRNIRHKGRRFSRSHDIDGRSTGNCLFRDFPVLGNPLGLRFQKHDSGRIGLEFDRQSLVRNQLLLSTAAQEHPAAAPAASLEWHLLLECCTDVLRGKSNCFEKIQTIVADVAPTNYWFPDSERLLRRLSSRLQRPPSTGSLALRSQVQLAVSQTLLGDSGERIQH